MGISHAQKSLSLKYMPAIKQLPHFLTPGPLALGQTRKSCAPLLSPIFNARLIP